MCDLHHAEIGQRLDRGSHRWNADAKEARQLTKGRKPIALAERTEHDVFAQLIHDLWDQRFARDWAEQGSLLPGGVQHTFTVAHHPLPEA
jgi:hypothetical protein